MSKDFDISAIRERMAQNRKEATKLADKLSVLDQEHSEMETALRVLERFGASLTASGVHEDAADRMDHGKLGPRRPEGTPTLHEMTVEVLRDAISKGKPGLPIKDIVTEIGNKYWPGVQPEQVTAPIYSFVKKGRLKKTEGGIFKPV